MQKTWPVFALMTFFVASAVHASDDICFEKAQTQSQLNECAAGALKLADSELNALYRRMQDRLKDDSSTKTLLIDAQRKWLGFRDSECSFAAVRSAGGSSHAMQVNACLTELTRTRVMELQNHLACGRGAGEQEAMQCALPRAGR
ncbi:lysozyme inhibitor LprI family protein [Comamonas sp. 4034]|uniref:lysozyme inhibitor LprI family protein n=1 Tax=Comamonas sp. 4034 TaxID=3156455 RepID=UPI000F9F3C67